jgi:hypothetical protein
MKYTISLFTLLLVSGFLFAQEFKRDSVVLSMNRSYRAKKKITIRLENRTGKEIFRLDPMQPPAIYRWNGKSWVAVEQIRYCGCSPECPPPPEVMPFNTNDVLEFEWDQMSAKCLDRDKGTVEKHKVKHGKYKVVFRFRENRYGEAFEVERTFKILCR